MKKLIALMVLWTTFVGALAPFAVQGQIIGKAMDQKLKGLGRNSAVEFNNNLLNLMEARKA